jgi:TonB family protein
MKARIIGCCGGLLFALAGFVAAAPADNQESVRALRLTHFVLPMFPSPVRIDGLVTGDAVVAISRDAAGQVLDVLALEATHAGFAEAAVEAAKKWRFAPLPADAMQPQLVPLVRFMFTEGGVVFVGGPVGKAGRAKTGLASFFQPSYRATSFDDLDTKPKALHQPMPAAPAGLRGKAARGHASVSFFVDTEGRVRVPAVVEASAPEFGAAAIGTVSQWRFDPPRRQGEPACAMERWSFNFGPESRD